MKKILKVIFIILIFATFVVTFGFSGQEGTESTGISRTLTLYILNIFGEYQEPLSTEEFQLVLEVEHIIRKIAHFSIYTFLGFCLMWFMSMFKMSRKLKIGASLGVGILYACLDEFHQSFIPGRTALIGDIFIDTAGVITGIIIMSIFICIYHKIRKKGKENKQKYK